MIRSLSEYGVNGQRLDVNTGVWIGKNKVSAIGITASRWVTMHGIAINIDCELNNFSRIVPCGIVEPNHGVTTLVRELPNNSQKDSVSTEVFANVWIDKFSEVFGMKVVVQDNPLNLLHRLSEQHNTTTEESCLRV